MILPLRPPLHNPAPPGRSFTRRLQPLLGLAFLCSLAAACAPARVEAARFDADRVVANAAAQCAFGPRIPGTPAHLQARDWLADRLREAGLDVRLQPFDAVLPLTGQAVQGWNLWAAPPAFSPGDVILLSAHWDTRPYADEEPDAADCRPFLGANDGAASAAFVIEAIRAARGTSLENRLAVVLFDIEDAGVSGDAGSWCLGSRHAARNPPPWMDRVRLGINIDMVAHPGLRLRKEGYSLESAPGAVDRLWRIGRDLAPSVFLDETRSHVMDDHVPFIEAGYPYIDLIGLPNPHWHRLSDRPENLDPRSIRAVAAVLLEFLRQELPAVSPAAPAETRN